MSDATMMRSVAIALFLILFGSVCGMFNASGIFEVQLLADAPQSMSQATVMHFTEGAMEASINPFGTLTQILPLITAVFQGVLHALTLAPLPDIIRRSPVDCRPLISPHMVYLRGGPPQLGGESAAMNHHSIPLIAAVCLCLILLLAPGSVVSATTDQAYRPPATSAISFIDDEGFSQFAQSMLPPTGPPDLEGMIHAASKPMTDQIGAFFYLILFGVPYLVLWIRQKNLLVPSILGIILGAWMLVKIPAIYTIPAVAALAMIVAGGVYSLYAKRT